MRYHIIYVAEDPRIDRTHKYSKLCSSDSHRGRGQQPPDPIQHWSSLVLCCGLSASDVSSNYCAVLVYEVDVGDERSRKRGHLKCETAALQHCRPPGVCSSDLQLG